MKCRICGNNDNNGFLDLGFHPLADTFLMKEQLSEPETFYPLRVQACPNCGLVQSEFVVSEYVRYQKNPYSYTSSSSLTARRHFSSLAEETAGHFNLQSTDLIVDIGANDGTLLKAFKDMGFRTMGVEPSSNISEIANVRGIETINAFFDKECARALIDKTGKASIAVATNVFNHVDDIYGFMDAIDLLLSKKGALIIEVPYLLDLIQNLAYDTIYLEHLSYFSVKPLKTFFSNVGFELFNVDRVDYMGGSLRLFAGRKGEHEVNKSVDDLIELEDRKKLHDKMTFENFSKKVYEMRDELVWLLYTLKRKKKRIVGIGAPAKGNTLLNFCKIGTNVLDFVTDVVPQKIGKYTPGTHIPIAGDERIYETKPDYALLLSWNLSKEILKKFSESSKFGGKFIIPIPTPSVLEEV